VSTGTDVITANWYIFTALREYRDLVSYYIGMKVKRCGKTLSAFDFLCFYSDFTVDT
jgi:hypothetical protein